MAKITITFDFDSEVYLPTAEREVGDEILNIEKEVRGLIQGWTSYNTPVSEIGITNVKVEVE